MDTMDNDFFLSFALWNNNNDPEYFSYAHRIHQQK